MEARTQQTGTQEVPGYYVWEVPGKPVVHLHLDLVDDVLAEVMRGFGAVPKRGAEVGGVLLGTVEPGADGSRTVIRIDGFQPVECGYRRGPSYLFTDEDAPAFEDACARWRPDPSRTHHAVGYFRSHTRDRLGMSIEDVELMDQFFPEPNGVALLIRPFATKVSVAGFFLREDGVFPETTPLEFPFRRRELSGEEPPPRRSSTDRAVAWETPAAESVAEPPRSRTSGWMWLPLSFLFLLLGVLLGYQAALTIGTKTSAGGASDFSLALTVSKDDDNLMVRWNRDAPAVKSAQRGVLEIQDGGYAKPVDLDAAHLQNGSIIYRNSSNTVRFRLELYLNPRLSVSETLDWKQ